MFMWCVITQTRNKHLHPETAATCDIRAATRYIDVQPRWFWETRLSEEYVVSL
jgi:hypothetical protein